MNHLQPKRQPGRVDRKAALYALEIVRLRSAGYTFEAIREALADAGVELSTSALRREVRRLRSQSAAVLPGSTSGPRAAQSNPVNAQPKRSPPDARSPPVSADPCGHELAEAFFTAHPSNPLVRTQESP